MGDAIIHLLPLGVKNFSLLQSSHHFGQSYYFIAVCRVTESPHFAAGVT